MNLNQCESPIECKLYSAMLARGMIPICQYKIGRFRVDFAFLEERIVVEADGKLFHRNKRKDKRRENYIKKCGWKILRFTGSQIYKDADKCARKIKIFLRTVQ